MAPLFLPEASSFPIGDRARPHGSLKTAGSVKRSGCDDFTGSCVVFGQGGEVLTTVTVYAPGQVTTVEGAIQTIQQTETHVVQQTTTVTAEPVTRTSTVLDAGTTKEETYCVVTVAGTSIKDLECHTGLPPPKDPYPVPSNYDDADWDPGWAVGLGVGLVVLLLLFLAYIYSRRKKSHERLRGHPGEKRFETEPEAAFRAGHEHRPMMAGGVPAPSVGRSHHSVPRAPHPLSDAASHHVLPHAADPSLAHLAPRVPAAASLASSGRRGRQARVHVNDQHIQVDGHDKVPIIINSNRYYGYRGANSRAALAGDTSYTSSHTTSTPAYTYFSYSPNARTFGSQQGAHHTTTTNAAFDHRRGSLASSHRSDERPVHH